SQSRYALCATVSPRIYWKTETTFALFRRCWAIATCALPRSTRTSLPAPSAQRSVHLKLWLIKLTLTASEDATTVRGGRHLSPVRERLQTQTYAVARAASSHARHRALSDRSLGRTC